MDNSQSSDLLSESTDLFCNSPTESTTMDIISYKSLVLNTKSAFSSITKEIKKSTFSVYFSTLLEDCGTCISQSLDLITDILSGTSLKQNKLVDYMTDAVCLLQLLSDLIKNVLESISLSCHSMKTFPTVTSRIIKQVFIHCKDSESLYGSMLNTIEKQLKDLFRSCHDLQITYLMVLEKHFIFDLTEREEQDILIEALDINLKIGEIVQSLDVKTMAEQWKAYTVICEKYSNCLMDKRIYCDCIKILCSMISKNIETALEENQEEKIVLRSLKVSSFTLKIMLRVCNTFRHAVLKDYECIVGLLLYVHLNNEAYLQTIHGKCSRFINLFNTHVTSPVNLLLSELLLDEKLFAYISNYDIIKIRKEDKLLGLIVLIPSIIRIILQKNSEQGLNVRKHWLIDLIFKLLPHCHVWFNMGLRFNCAKPTREYSTYGLYEQLLAHTLSLAATMDTEEVNVLEKRMVEGILSTECYSAMFSSNLWVLMSRMSSRQFVLAQVMSLIKMYQKLEKNRLFADSPQRVHLSHTISRLYEVMHNEDKMKVYNIISIHDDKNRTLWSCLKLCNLPNEVHITAEEIIMEKLKTQIRKMATDNVEVDDLINTIKLASTCSLINREDEMEYLVLEAWSKACPKNIENIAKDLDKGTVWYYRYIEALVALTNSMEHIFHGNSANLVKVLHTVSIIVQSGCKELKLPLINILCKLANFETYDMNKHLLDSILTQTFTELFLDTDLAVKNKLFYTLRKHRTNNVDRIVTKIVNDDDSLQDTWGYFIRHGTLKIIELKEQLLFTTDFKYCHKCIESIVEIRDSGSLSTQKSVSNNFDFVDIDSLFDADTDEPACKKAKLNTNEVEQIISRLETDASLLCKIKENIFTSQYTNRIKAVCSKLNNIVE